MEDMNELLRQIKPCREGRDYIFVSYSSADKDVVYRDVAQFQRQGYNVWLDERNLDKTKASWKQDALKAIQSWRCKLLVFYVSKNSLVSRPCYNELQATRDEVTRKLHGFKDLKFIAVEVERFDDILQYKEQIAQELYSREQDQDKCLDKINTLCDFVDHFFNGNNERVRIHARKSVGDDDRYYASVLEAFPKEAKGLEEDVQEEDVQEENVQKENVLEENVQEENIQIDMEEKVGTEMESMPGEGNSQDSDSNQDDTTGLVEEQGRKGKRKEGKGDICYQIYGKEYTENQSSMMLRVFAQVLKRHQDKVDRLPEQPLMNCASQINYKVQENRTDKMPSYFRVCEYFEFDNGSSVCIGTAYAIADKMKKIAALLQYCQEDREIFQSEDVELPELKNNKAGRKASDGEKHTGLKGRTTKTANSFMED